MNKPEEPEIAFNMCIWNDKYTNSEKSNDDSHIELWKHRDDYFGQFTISIKNRARGCCTNIHEKLTLTTEKTIKEAKRKSIEILKKLIDEINSNDIVIKDSRTDDD